MRVTPARLTGIPTDNAGRGALGTADRRWRLVRLGVHDLFSSEVELDVEPLGCSDQHVEGLLFGDALPASDQPDGLSDQTAAVHARSEILDSLGGRQRHPGVSGKDGTHGQIVVVEGIGLGGIEVACAHGVCLGKEPKGEDALDVQLCAGPGGEVGPPLFVAESSGLEDVVSADGVEAGAFTCLGLESFHRGWDVVGGGWRTDNPAVDDRDTGVLTGVDGVHRQVHDANVDVDEYVEHLTD